uniref:F-box domain-containing protein n=1 Tax=Capra hircus TaxID=9925 RepID=A0A8C2SK06_CAPHI
AADVDQLPNELLQEVLSYLPPSTLLRQSRQVCRRWRDVVDGWDLWRMSLYGAVPRPFLYKQPDRTFWDLGLLAGPPQ